jgi:hypothetical protein
MYEPRPIASSWAAHSCCMTSRVDISNFVSSGQLDDFLDQSEVLLHCRFLGVIERVVINKGDHSSDLFDTASQMGQIITMLPFSVFPCLFFPFVFLGSSLQPRGATLETEQCTAHISSRHMFNFTKKFKETLERCAQWSINAKYHHGKGSWNRTRVNEPVIQV